MRDFRKLDVWKKSHALTLQIYKLTSEFPTTEEFGLTSQLQRAGSSIGANLAEGCGRETNADYRRFVQLASGSACEVEYHLILARDLGLIDDARFKTLEASINEIKRMLVGLAKFLKQDTTKTSPEHASRIH